MSARVARPLAWAVWIAGVASIVAAGFLATRYPVTSIHHIDPVGEAVWAMSWIGFGLVGALIVSQRPSNRIGWILCGITFSLGVAIFLPAYARAAYENPQAGLPLASMVTWLAAWAFAPVPALVIGLLLLFPSGTLPARRHRVAAALVWTLLLLTVVAEALQPGPVEGDGPPMNPLGVTALGGPLDAALELLQTLFGVVAVAVLVDLVYRFWRSRGVQRQQFRWMALAAAAFPLLFMLAMVVEAEITGEEGFDPVVVVFFVCGNGLAAAIGIAVTRYGLYEINRVVSRTVAYVLLTGVLVGLYLLAVTTLTALTAPVTGDSPLAVAAATLIAAAAFRPTRRRIQSAVDRRFNRARYDAARTVESYRSRLRDEVNINALADDLLETVAASMQPVAVTIWLREAADPSDELFSDQPAAVTVPERHSETRGM